MKDLRTTLLDLKLKNVFKASHEVPNRLFKNHWKSKFKMLEVEKEEKLSKKVNVEGSLNKKISTKMFLCKLDLIKEWVKSKQYFSSDCKDQIPYQHSLWRVTIHSSWYTPCMETCNSPSSETHGTHTERTQYFFIQSNISLRISTIRPLDF